MHLLMACFRNARVIAFRGSAFRAKGHGSFSSRHVKAALVTRILLLLIAKRKVSPVDRGKEKEGEWGTDGTKCISPPSHHLPSDDVTPVQPPPPTFGRVVFHEVHQPIPYPHPSTQIELPPSRMTSPTDDDLQPLHHVGRTRLFQSSFLESIDERVANYSGEVGA